MDAAEQLALLVKAKKVPKARKRSLAAAIGRTEEELDAAHKVAQMDAETLEDLRGEEIEFDWVELGDYDEVKDVSNAQVTLMRAKAKDEQEGNAKRGAWKTAMQELRAKKARTERIETLKAELAEKKVNTVHWVWNWSYSTARPLEELVSGIGMPMSEQGHSETCEGHAATIDPDAAEVVWLCVDWKKHGHRIAGAAQGDDGDGEPDEEEAAKAEAVREERRRVKVNNLAWRTARAGREAHIADMCKDKGEAPADVKDLIMRTLLASDGHYTHYVGSQEHGAMLAKFLGDERLTRHPKDVISSLIKKTASKRYWWTLFAHVAGYFEAEHMKDDAWRGEPHYHHGPSVRGRIRPATAEWISFLKHHGYGVTEVEAEAVATAEQEAEAEAERRAEQERQREEREAARAARQAENPTPDEDEESSDDGDDGEEDYQYDDTDEEYEEPAGAVENTTLRPRRTRARTRRRGTRTRPPRTTRRTASRSNSGTGQARSLTGARAGAADGTAAPALETPSRTRRAHHDRRSYRPPHRRGRGPADPHARSPRADGPQRHRCPDRHRHGHRRHRGRARNLDRGPHRPHRQPR